MRYNICIAVSNMHTSQYYFACIYTTKQYWVYFMRNTSHIIGHVGIQTYSCIYIYIYIYIYQNVIILKNEIKGGFINKTCY